VVTTVANSASNRSNGKHLLYLCRIRNSWAGHDERCGDSTIRRYEETEVKGNDDTTHRKRSPGVEPGWREVKEFYELI
jgi:hypothetical protein